MERGLARRRQSPGRHRQIAAPEQIERPVNLTLLYQILLFLTFSLATLVSFHRFSHVKLQQPPCPVCPACPLIPAGQNFSWIDYIPRFRDHKDPEDKRTGHLYPAWEVFNASDASALWADPVLPTEEESFVCLRRIRRSYRALIALWHPDRASPPTNESIGGLRTLLNLSNQKLSMINQILNQAYNDAVFGCMTAGHKSSWLNRLTDRHPDEWSSLEAFDVASKEPVDGVDPSDLGLDLTPREYVHVRQCMERGGVPWEVALYKLREQRRSLFWRCKMAVEHVAEWMGLSGREGAGQEYFSFRADPVVDRLIRRQRALERLMKRTGALGGCADMLGFQTRPWWEWKDFNSSMCDAAWPEHMEPIYITSSDLDW